MMAVYFGYQALDVARGVNYLHEKSIVHGDLKGVSVLGLYMPNNIKLLIGQHSHYHIGHGMYRRLWAVGDSRIHWCG
jgi:hypothetical protein